MRRLAGALATLLVCGCSVADDGAASGANATAERVAAVMQHHDARLADSARRLRNPEIEVLEVTGTRFGGRLEIRVTHRKVREVLVGAEDVHVAVRCYRFDYFRHRDPRPKRIDCPKGPTTTLPPATTVVQLGSDTEMGLRAALEALPLGDRTDPEALRRAATAASPGAGIDVAVIEGTGGVAVNAGGECVFGQATPTGVLVWHVPDVMAQPGELGCRGDSAAQGQGQHAPH